MTNEEKTGVITGLVLLGVAAGYLFSSSEVEASTCVSGWNNNTTHSGVDHWNNWCDWCAWNNWTNWSKHSRAG